MGPLNRRQMVKDRVFRTHVLSTATAIKVDGFAPNNKTIARAYRATRAQAAGRPSTLSPSR